VSVRYKVYFLFVRIIKTPVTRLLIIFFFFLGGEGGEYYLLQITFHDIQYTVTIVFKIYA